MNNELLNISDHELKSVVEEHIIKLVEQLVQRASLSLAIREEIDSLDSMGYSLLHYGCLYNLVALIPLLVVRGARINKKTSSGATALHLAATAGYLGIVKLLVEHGVDVDVVDADNRTAFTLATLNNHLDIAAYLEQVHSLVIKYLYNVF
jgi:ankyrin repeat protein